MSSPLPASERKRRHAVREAHRRASGAPRKSRAKPPAKQRPRARRDADWTAKRAEARRTFEARAPLPAGMMLGEGAGLYSGRGVLVGPRDFASWLAWSRCPWRARRAA